MPLVPPNSLLGHPERDPDGLFSNISDHDKRGFQYIVDDVDFFDISGNKIAFEELERHFYAGVFVIVEAQPRL